MIPTVLQLLQGLPPPDMSCGDMVQVLLIAHVRAVPSVVRDILLCSQQARQPSHRGRQLNNALTPRLFLMNAKMPMPSAGMLHAGSGSDPGENYSDDSDEVMSPAPAVAKAKARAAGSKAAPGASRLGAAARASAASPKVAFGRTVSSSPVVEKKAAVKRKPRKCMEVIFQAS